jgi:formate hydrogenlyase subunit 6
VQKEIDYAIALLRHNGDASAENRRAAFETCPACKRQHSLASSASAVFHRQLTGANG